MGPDVKSGSRPGTSFFKSCTGASFQKSRPRDEFSQVPFLDGLYQVQCKSLNGTGLDRDVPEFHVPSPLLTETPYLWNTYFGTPFQVISCNQKNVCTLQITDTTGSHQFPAMQRLSVSKGHAFVLVYSVTSRQSLEELGPIVMMLKEVKGDQLAEAPIMLVGNKKDESNVRNSFH